MRSFWLPLRTGGPDAGSVPPEAVPLRLQLVENLAFAQIPVLNAVSTHPNLSRSFLVPILFLLSWHSQALNLVYVGQSHSGFHIGRMQNNMCI
jgi:hypothetical protein